MTFELELRIKKLTGRTDETDLHDVIAYLGPAEGEIRYCAMVSFIKQTIPLGDWEGIDNLVKANHTDPIKALLANTPTLDQDTDNNTTPVPAKAYLRAFGDYRLHRLIEHAQNTTDLCALLVIDLLLEHTYRYDTRSAMQEALDKDMTLQQTAKYIIKRARENIDGPAPDYIGILDGAPPRKRTMTRRHPVQIPEFEDARPSDYLNKIKAA